MLLDASDFPVNGVNDMTFSIYDAPELGNLIWQEVHAAVAFDDGLYTVQLGSITPLDPALFDQSPLYLGVEVGADGEMAPRIPLASVPFAFRADIADSSPWAG